MSPPSVNRARQDEAIFARIAEAAAAGAPSPTHDDLRAAVQAAGMRGIGTCELTISLRRLKADTRISIDGDKCHRVYVVPGIGCTTARVNLQGWGGFCKTDAERATPWPKVTAASAAPYDYAVARKVFADPRHNTGERPAPIQAVRGSYGAHSLTGCSAAMVASS